jgi:hypothetical protein
MASRHRVHKRKLTYHRRRCCRSIAFF